MIDIGKFNRPGSDTFVFLLSTRAGGLGVNLQTAGSSRISIFRIRKFAILRIRNILFLEYENVLFLEFEMLYS